MLFKVSAVFGAIFISSAMQITHAEELTQRLNSCGAIENDDVRLECFDALVVDIAQIQSIASAASVEPPANAAIVDEDPEESFGQEDLASTKEEKKKRREQTKSITVPAIDIARNDRGKYIVILENGQIWRQLKADTARLLVPRTAENETITVSIKRKMLGGHSLSIEGDRRSIRVERIK
ncbi:MAG: hypothetical protein ACX939_07080 [Hyphococcus sp.]